jgi:hypothetical protein
MRQEISRKAAKTQREEAKKAEEEELLCIFISFASSFLGVFARGS